jgi:CarD family transcriptional regulator
MYKINDVVVYGTEGICTITDIAEMKFGGERSEYYILSPVTKAENTVYVPKNNDKVLNRMRRIISREDAERLLDSMPVAPMEWIVNDRERQAAYKNVLLCGKPDEVLRMISSLYNRQTEQLAAGKKLHASDERFLRDAERMLFNEIGYAMGISTSEVLSMVLRKIRS